METAFAMNSWFPMSLSFLLIPHFLAPLDHVISMTSMKKESWKSQLSESRAWGKKEAAEAEVEAAVAEAVKVASEAGWEPFFPFCPDRCLEVWRMQFWPMIGSAAIVGSRPVKLDGDRKRSANLTAVFGHSVTVWIVMLGPSLALKWQHSLLLFSQLNWKRCLSN